jgi:hypothetical protein
MKQSQFVSHLTSMVEVLVDQVQHLVQILLLLMSLFLPAPFTMLLMLSFFRCVVQHVNTGFLKCSTTHRNVQRAIEMFNEQCFGSLQTVHLYWSFLHVYFLGDSRCIVVSGNHTSINHMHGELSIYHACSC